MLVKVYKEFGRDVFFLRVEDSGDMQLGWEKPKWFVMNFSVREKDVVVSAEPSVDIYAYPFRLVIERIYGTNLVYYNNVWQLSYTGNTVVFSNDVFFVSMSK